MKMDKKVAIILFYMLLLALEVYSEDNSCVINGTLSTTNTWFGYLFQKTLNRLEFRVSLPVSQCCPKLLLYFDEQLCNLTQNMTCEQKEGILALPYNQVINLNDAFYGCSISNVTGTEPLLVCQDQTSFESSKPRSWHVAVSKCDSSDNTELNLDYHFNLTGVNGTDDDMPMPNCTEILQEMNTNTNGSIINSSSNCETATQHSSTNSTVSNWQKTTQNTSASAMPVYYFLTIMSCMILFKIR